MAYTIHTQITEGYKAIEAIISQGILGAVTILFLIAIVALWKKESTTQQKIWDLTTDVKEIMKDLTTVVTSVFKVTENMPEKVKKEIQADLDRLEATVKRIEEKLDRNE